MSGRICKVACAERGFAHEGSPMSTSELEEAIVVMKRRRSKERLRLYQCLTRDFYLVRLALDRHLGNGESRFLVWDCSHNHP